MIMTTKPLFYNFLILLRSSGRTSPVKIENFVKKNYGRFKIKGWSKKQQGTFSGGKLLADSKNVYVLYAWRSLSTARDYFTKNLIFFILF
jgi:hypothetical protein